MASSESHVPPIKESSGRPKMPLPLLIVIIINGLLLFSSLQNVLIFFVFVGIENLAAIVFFITTLIGIPLMVMMFFAFYTKKGNALMIAQIRSFHLAIFALTGIVWMAATQFPESTSGSIESFEKLNYFMALGLTSLFFGGLTFLHFYLLSRKQVKDYMRAFKDMG